MKSQIISATAAAIITPKSTMSSSFCIDALLAEPNTITKPSLDSVSTSSSTRDSPTLSIDETRSSPRSPSSPSTNNFELRHSDISCVESDAKSGGWPTKQIEMALSGQHPGSNLSSAMSSLFAHPNASFYASLYANSLNVQESHSAQNNSQIPLSFLPPSAFQSAFHQIKSQSNSSSLTFDWLTKEMLCHHSNGKSTLDFYATLSANVIHQNSHLSKVAIAH